jgi:hypothetical protein
LAVDASNIWVFPQWIAKTGGVEKLPNLLYGKHGPEPSPVARMKLNVQAEKTY